MNIVEEIKKVQYNIQVGLNRLQKKVESGNSRPEKLLELARALGRHLGDLDVLSQHADSEEMFQVDESITIDQNQTLRDLIRRIPRACG